MEFATVGSPVLWAGFILFVIGMLALDLGVFNRKAHVITAREALAWSAVWVSLAGVFGAGLWAWAGPQAGLEFFTGYVIEKSLAVDNIFVFVAIFGAFAVPAASQHRVLLWGILGALIMRALFILVGAAMLDRFHWLLYVFGGFLVLTGVRMLVMKEKETDPAQNAIVRLVRRVLPVTDRYHGERFLIRDGVKWVATPLLLVLVLIEVSDLIFAVDSIPAIFAVTRDPFLVFTSNIFAILGLRSMYFLLADVIRRFVYLKTGLALVLAFVGTKMLLLDVVKIPIAASLGVVASLIVGSILVSLIKTREGVVEEAG